MFLLPTYSIPEKRLRSLCVRCVPSQTDRRNLNLLACCDPRENRPFCLPEPSRDEGAAHSMIVWHPETVSLRNILSEWDSTRPGEEPATTGNPSWMKTCLKVAQGKVAIACKGESRALVRNAGEEDGIV